MKYSNYTSISTSSNVSTSESRIENTKFEQETLIKNTDVYFVDQMVYEWLDSTLDIMTTGQAGKRNKVPIEMATQERWFKALKENNTRDKNRRVILPHIAIRRTGEKFNDAFLRPIIPETELTISITPYSERSSNYLVSSTPFRSNKIVYDSYTIPQPVFIEVNYDILVRTDFHLNMNEIEMQILSSYVNGNNSPFWLIKDHYKFLTEIGEPTDQSNTEDFSDSERIIKKIFPITVYPFLIYSSPNQKNKIKISRSSTRISFGIESDVEGTLL